MVENTRSVEARRGEKMIEVKVRFWTNNIAETKGHIVPKHCWAGGMIYTPKNASHGIKSSRKKPFHSLDEVQSVIEQAIIDGGIKVHESKRSTKKTKRVLGLRAGGTIRMSDDFDAPLPEEYWLGTSQ